MEAQIISAIQIAADPSQDRSLQAQAVDFLNVVRTNARESCGVALTLFLEQNPDGSRKNSPHVRVFALQMLDDFLDGSLEPLEGNAFQALEQAFVMYIQSEYIQGPAEASAPYIRNKFSHTLALLFLRCYPRQWSTFFPTIYSLLRPSPPASDPSSSSNGLPPINGHVSILFLRLLIEISGEVHDAILKGARTWTEERQTRDGTVRHTIRENEAENMNTAVLTIVAEAEEPLNKLREEIANSGETPERVRERAGLEEVIELGVKAFAGYVSWVDINLTVNQHTIPLIFRLLADPATTIRQATAFALLRIVTKGLKDPCDKLQLIRVLSLGEVLEALEEKSRQRRDAKPGQTDEAEETYRESLGKLACGLGAELVDLLADQNLSLEHREIAEQLLAQLLPVAIRFLADEYDDTSSTMFTFFHSILSSYKKAKKASPQTHLTEPKRQFLISTLNVIIQKLKWDSDTAEDEEEFEEMDEDDKTAFEKMRQDLRTLMDSIGTIDDQLVADAVQQIAVSTLIAYQTARASGAPDTGGISWKDAELAVYLVHLYGELRPKGKFAFVQIPPELAESKPKRKNVDMSTLPLTQHGELMFAVVNSSISSYPHTAVRGQFFEVVGRYLDFFKVRKDCVVPVLEALVDTRGMHQARKNRRGRVFYVFHRFIKEVRNDIPQDLILSLLTSIQDLLELELEPPPADADGNSSSSAGSSPTPDQDASNLLEEAIKAPGLFDSQLYLFETTGTLISSLAEVGEDEQVSLLRAITNPLLGQLSQALQTPMKDPKDILPVFKAHHLIQAVASIVKGFPDAPPQVPGYVPPKRMEVFKEIAEAVLVSLEAFNTFKVIRDAARFAFTRIIAAAATSVAQYVPVLTSRLLAVESEPSELVELFSFLGLVFHRHLGDEVLDMLDQLIAPLTTKVSSVILRPIDGTDALQAHEDTKKAYLEFILTIMTGPLYTVFISSRNGPHFESLVGGIVEIAADTSYPPTQKTAFTILSRFTTHFGAPEGSKVMVKDRSKPAAVDEVPTHYVPGFERVVYERLIPLAFSLPGSPGFNIKDAQSLQVLGEIGVMLKAAHKARGQEVLDFLANSFLPSQNSPPPTTLEFVTKLSELDSKSFRKYFTEFVRGAGAVNAPPR
ncbi:pre-tRNA nuclear export protein [Tulasnella sp. 403]|nr:pre-tRNA nuclear export protein [Tulasnella sp. 403]